MRRSKRSERRTGCYGAQFEIPPGAGYAVQAQALVEQLNKFAQERLVQATDDGREYSAHVEFKITTCVDPSQAQVGEFVFKDALYKYPDVFSEDAVGLLLPASGFVIDGKVRIFWEQGPVWSRIK
jgi:hypothetical protein